MKTNIIRMLLAISTVILIANCAPTGGSPAAELGNQQADAEAPAFTMMEPADCYIPNQVLITGRSGSLSDPTTVESITASLQNLEEVPGAASSMNYFSAFLDRVAVDPKPPLLPFFPTDSYGTLVTKLYRITDGQSVEEVVIRIAQESTNQEAFVFADPNYVIGYPWTTEGLTWLSKGSPDSVDSASADPNNFENQWAFHIISLYPRPNNGENVWVGVFDSFPDLDYESQGEVLARPPDPPIIMTDHGPFVQKLIEHMAPEAKVFPYRVLNDYGQGTLNVLVAKLDEFMAQVSNDWANIAGGVINLSLGIHPDCKPAWDPDIESLWRLIGAYQSNIVVVAAAGNDSTAEAPQRMQIPANWGAVIGVGASNWDGTRACFSNEGEVLAPGGEGVEDCQPALNKCPDFAPDCPYGVISVAPSSSTSYAYWAGTSFATPLVSGLAALLMTKEGEEFKSAFEVAGSHMTPTINRAITCRDEWWKSRDQGENLVAHMMNVSATFDSGNCLRHIGRLHLPLTGDPPDYIGNVPQDGVITGVWNGSDFPIMLTSPDVFGDPVTVAPRAYIHDFDGAQVAGDWKVFSNDGRTPDIWIDWTRP